MTKAQTEPRAWDSQQSRALSIARSPPIFPLPQIGGNLACRLIYLCSFLFSLDFNDFVLEGGQG